MEPQENYKDLAKSLDKGLPRAVSDRYLRHPETFCRNLYEEIRKIGKLELRYYFESVILTRQSEAFQEQFLTNERHIAASSSYLDLGKLVADHAIGIFY